MKDGEFSCVILCSSAVLFTVWEPRLVLARGVEVSMELDVDEARKYADKDDQGLFRTGEERNLR